jgi:hypothetical protein
MHKIFSGIYWRKTNFPEARPIVAPLRGAMGWTCHFPGASPPAIYILALRANYIFRVSKKTKIIVQDGYSSGATSAGRLASLEISRSLTGTYLDSAKSRNKTHFIVYSIGQTAIIEIKI